MGTKVFHRAAARAPERGGRIPFRGGTWIRRDRDGSVIVGKWASPLMRVGPDGELSVQLDGWKPGFVAKAIALAVGHATGRPVKVDGRKRPLVIKFLDTNETLPIPDRWQHIT